VQTLAYRIQYVSGAIEDLLPNKTIYV